MKEKLTIITFFIVSFFIFTNCKNNSSKEKDGSAFVKHDTDEIVNDSLSNENKNSDDSNSFSGTEPDQVNNFDGSESNDLTKNQFEKVKNLLEFMVRDTMKTDSTYVATLAMATDISSPELELKIKDIIDPYSKVMVKDTTQEITMQMSATLEDKSSPNDPNFLIRQIGSISNVRTYDAKKNKMIWQWNVTPMKAGLHELLLSISQVDNNEHIIGSPETRRHDILIFSEKRKSGFFKSIGNFFSDNGKWIIAAILLPIFIAWYTTSLKRRWEKKDSGNNNK